MSREDVVYDKRVQNNAYSVMAIPTKAMCRAEIYDLVIKTRCDIVINIEVVDCDYYRFLSGDTLQINAFHCEYMTNYSWAEFTLAELVQTRTKE